ISFVSSVNEIYNRCDIISLHIPHTLETEKMINREVIFNKLLKSPIIINTSRGMLVDSDGIIEGLAEGKIRGYLADVLAVEPIEENEKLRGIENIIITPHVGSRTNQSVVRQGTMAVNNLIDLIEKH